MDRMDDQLHEFYLQISPNLMATFSADQLPVDLFEWDTDLDRIVLVQKKGESLSAVKNVKEACREGRLFLQREDYRHYAEHLSRNLGLVLTEERLDEREVGETFFRALKMRLVALYKEPSWKKVERLKGDLGILCEYLWSNPCRIGVLIQTQDRAYSPETHAVNCIFIGLALRIMSARRDVHQLDLMSLALGLALMDIGMTRVEALANGRDGIPVHKDRDALHRHPNLGVNMLSRLRVEDAVVHECVLHHHERVDGSGYPARLKGENVGFHARVCGLADAFCSAMGKAFDTEALELEKTVQMFEADNAFDSRLTGLLWQLVMAEKGRCPVPFAHVIDDND